MRKQFFKPQNIIVYTAIILGTAVGISGCRKDSTNDTKPTLKKISDTIVFTDDEEKYDRVIETVAYGLLDLSENTTFRTLVNDEIAKQFDGDDNVLLKTLSYKCKAEGIDLKAEMVAALNKYKKSELASLVDEAINGVSYYDRTIYPQVFIPFIEEVDINVKPVITLNYNGDETLETIGKDIERPDEIQSGSATASSAQLNLHWVVSVNEIVGNDGLRGIRETPIDPIPIRATLTPGRKYWHLEVRQINVSEKKEAWGNGRADISYIANHYKPGCDFDAVGSRLLMRIANGGLDHTFDPEETSCGECESHVIAVWEEAPNRQIWEDNETISILFYERDVRARFERIFQLSPYCSSSNVYISSKEDIYGIYDVMRDESKWIDYPGGPGTPPEYASMSSTPRAGLPNSGMDFTLEGGRYQ